MKHDARELEIIANRKRFVHELRTTHENQTKFFFRSPNRREYCAVGFCYFIVMREDVPRSNLSIKVATHLGLSNNYLCMIMGWNNDGSTFAEIADKFEKANFPIYKDINIKIPKKANILSPFEFGERFQFLLEELSSNLGERRPREEKEAGRITLEQWFERYSGDPQSSEQSA